MGLYDRDYMRDTAPPPPPPARKRRWVIIIAVIALGLYLLSIL